MKNCFKTTVFFIIGLLAPSLCFAQFILERQAGEVILSGVEQAFVQKITTQADTKTAKYISIGDISQYEENGIINFSLPGIPETLQSEAVRVEYTQSITIYPNPAYDNIIIGNLPNEKGQFTTISIWDNLGKQVHEIESSELEMLEITTDRMPNGMYFIKICSGNNQSIHTIILQK